MPRMLGYVPRTPLGRRGREEECFSHASLFLRASTAQELIRILGAVQRLCSEGPGGRPVLRSCVELGFAPFPRRKQASARSERLCASRRY